MSFLSDALAHTLKGTQDPVGESPDTDDLASEFGGGTRRHARKAKRAKHRAKHHARRAPQYARSPWQQQGGGQGGPADGGSGGQGGGGGDDGGGDDGGGDDGGGDDMGFGFDPMYLQDPVLSAATAAGILEPASLATYAPSYMNRGLPADFQALSPATKNAVGGALLVPGGAGLAVGAGLGALGAWWWLRKK